MVAGLIGHPDAVNAAPPTVDGTPVAPSGWIARVPRSANRAAATDSSGDNSNASSASLGALAGDATSACDEGRMTVSGEDSAVADQQGGALLNDRLALSRAYAEHFDIIIQRMGRVAGRPGRILTRYACVRLARDFSHDNETDSALAFVDADGILRALRTSRSIGTTWETALDCMPLGATRILRRQSTTWRGTSRAPSAQEAAVTNSRACTSAIGRSGGLGVWRPGSWRLERIYFFLLFLILLLFSGICSSVACVSNV